MPDAGSQIFLMITSCSLETARHPKFHPRGPDQSVVLRYHRDLHSQAVGFGVVQHTGHVSISEAHDPVGLGLEDVPSSYCDLPQVDALAVGG